jgi:hypothetical protein
MGDTLPIPDGTDEWAGPPHVVLDKIEGAPRCAALLDIWKVAREGDRPIAARAALDPIVLAKAGLLPFVWILERDPSNSYFYRLIGEGVRRNFNMAMRGKHLHEIFDEDTTALVASRCDRILADREVMFSTGRVFRDDEVIYSARRLMLPLSDEDGVPRYLIGTVDQEDMTDDRERRGNPRFELDFVAFVGVDSI